MDYLSEKKENFTRIFFVFIFCSLSPIFIVSAEEARLFINAERLKVDQEENLAVFEGNVHARQQSYDLKCARLIIFYNAKQKTPQKQSCNNFSQMKIKKMEAYGHVLIKRGTKIIKGDHAIFSPSADNIIVTGKDLILEDGKKQATGCTLIFNRKTTKTTLEGCPENGNKKKKGITITIDP